MSRMFIYKLVPQVCRYPVPSEQHPPHIIPPERTSFHISFQEPPIPLPSRHFHNAHSPLPLLSNYLRHPRHDMLNRSAPPLTETLAAASEGNAPPSPPATMVDAAARATTTAPD